MSIGDYRSASSYMEMERMMRELDYRNEKRMHEMVRQFQYQTMPMAQPMSNPFQSAPTKPSPEVKAQKEKKDKLKSLVAYYYHKRK